MSDTEGGRMADVPDKPKRLTLSQIVEMMLTRGGGERSSITLARAPNGETAIEVKVRTGDDGEVVTVEEAEQKAREVYERIREAYPLGSGHDNAAVSLTRNAKGETQIDTTIRTGESGPRTIEEAETKALEVYTRMRARFPMANGLTAKPGSVA